jgi:SAM-dependent methyltransferase
MTHHWDDIAAVRRQQIEDGRDLTFSRVFVPYYWQLISTLAPSSILEIGGGTGHLARSLSAIAKRYAMLEPSQGMYGVAREVLADGQVEIHNCTVETFPACGQFDLVLSHMCVQAVGELRGFLKALAKQIYSSGVFLLSLPHPVFYNDYKRFFPQDKFRYTNEQSQRVSFSITLDPDQVIEDVPYHHRPVSKYVSCLADAGLCLTYFEEIFPGRDIQELYGHPWENPRYLVLGGCHTETSPLNQKLVQSCFPRT